MGTRQPQASPSTELLNYLDQAQRKDFEANRRILSFDEYLEQFLSVPERHGRGSAQYVVDMLDHFGKAKSALAGASSAEREASPHWHFNVFDRVAETGASRVIGQDPVQTQVYHALQGFTRIHINNKLLLLHGPNGSSKSSLVHALMAGLEIYSHQNEGAAYHFNWIFPAERHVKPGIGLNTYSTARPDSYASYAKLPDDEIAARVPCDLKDHPLLLIPVEQRRPFLEKFLGLERGRAVYEHLPQYLARGDLCHRCRQIYDALLISHQGDARKVLQNIQVERLYFSRRYRRGLVTIEPQLHVDAQYQLLAYNKSVSALPAALQNINLFTVTGDLIDGNRGIIEFSDLLKKPLDSFKYLLIACETGAVNVGAAIAYLDTVMLGSTNELQLDAFKEFPDFTSFKARFELIRVPYLLQISQEKRIYEQQLESIAGGKHVAPHAAWSLALWAVLSRLKKPNSINYPPNVSHLVSNLTPLEKAKLYESGECPASLSPEDRKLLRASLRKIREEYSNVPYYEGRMGASAREMKSILQAAAQNHEFDCLSPLAVLRALEDFTKRVTEYDFLKQDVKDGFHDAVEFINTTRSEYLNLVDQEVRDSIGLYSTAQWEDFLRKYVLHVSLALKKEKIKNPITGKLEDPDFALIDEFEQIVGVGAEAVEKNAFRQNLISQVGAWSLDHPNETVVYAKVFPEYWRKLEKHYYESQKALLTQMHDALLVYGRGGNFTGGAPEGARKSPADAADGGADLGRKTIENMKEKLGYCDHCAREVITFLMRSRY